MTRRIEESICGGAVDWTIPKGWIVVSNSAPLAIQRAIPPWHKGKPLARWIAEDQERPKREELERWQQKMKEPVLSRKRKR